MNPQYNSLRSQAERLRHRFDDVIDDKSRVGGLAQDIRNVEEYFEMNKAPRSIDDLVKKVLSQLDAIKSDSTIMDVSHQSQLYREYEDLREDLRKLPNY